MVSKCRLSFAFLLGSLLLFFPRVLADEPDSSWVGKSVMPRRPGVPIGRYDTATGRNKTLGEITHFQVKVEEVKSGWIWVRSGGWKVG
jgi:hypothetical protein